MSWRVRRANLIDMLNLNREILMNDKLFYQHALQIIWAPILGNPWVDTPTNVRPPLFADPEYVTPLPYRGTIDACHARGDDIAKRAGDKL